LDAIFFYLRYCLNGWTGWCMNTCEDYSHCEQLPNRSSKNCCGKLVACRLTIILRCSRFLVF
jgi:hypothetical protein